MNYILDGKNIKEEPDGEAWLNWFGRTDRHVAEDTFGKTTVSTVFLGIDHNHLGSIPILFETMIFGGPFDSEQERYATYEQAENGHKRWVEKVKLNL